MQLKSAAKETVNYPLKKELTPVLMSIALGISGYASDTSDLNVSKNSPQNTTWAKDANGTEMKIFKGMVLGQQAGTSCKGESRDSNSTSLPYKTEIQNTTLDGVLIVGKMPVSLTPYTAGESEEREGILVPNADIVVPDIYLPSNTPDQINNVDTPWKKVEKPSMLLGYVRPAVYTLTTDKEDQNKSQRN